MLQGTPETAAIGRDLVPVGRGMSRAWWPFATASSIRFPPSPAGLAHTSKNEQRPLGGGNHQNGLNREHHDRGVGCRCRHRAGSGAGRRAGRPGVPPAAPPPGRSSQLYSPFTGEPVMAVGPVLTVKIDNLAPARPQAGLAGADIV